MTAPKGTTQLPPQLSTIAPDIDDMYMFIYWVSVVSFLLICGFMAYYVVKYRRRPGVKAEPTGHSTFIELVWTLSPLILLAYLFHQGFVSFVKAAVPPRDAIEVRVTGMQWSWIFEHPNGAIQQNELIVPQGKPVKLIMSSSDVLHSFFVPALRVKRDVVPGMYTTLWFEATELTGDNPLTVFCAEYCGAPRGISDGSVAMEPNSNHSTMLAKVSVVTPEEYEKETFRIYDESQKPPPECEGDPNPMACWGGLLYTQRGCNACHSTNPAVNAPGPSWATLWGASRAFEDGSSVTADENYILQSIRQPQAKIVKGFGNVNMPPYGERNLPQAQVDAIIAYMKKLHQ
jgi:cytochrome c oxidase subunit II